MADAGARLARAAPRAASLFLEEREVGAGVRATRGRPAGILGAERLSHAGRPVDGGAVRRTRAGAGRGPNIAGSGEEGGPRKGEGALPGKGYGGVGGRCKTANQRLYRVVPQ